MQEKTTQRIKMILKYQVLCILQVPCFKLYVIKPLLLGYPYLFDTHFPHIFPTHMSSKKEICLHRGNYKMAVYPLNRVYITHVHQVSGSCLAY